MDDAVKEQNQNLNTYISGPVYFRMWVHLFDFKNKQDRNSTLKDLLIYYVILVICMIFYHKVTDLFMAREVLILWVVFSFVGQLLTLSTYARGIRGADFPWWMCFFIFIPFVRIIPIIIIFTSNTENPKSRVIGLTIILDIVLIFTILIRVIIVDMFIGKMLVTYTTNVNDYEQYRNDVSYADKCLPETIEGFGNPIDIKFGYKKVSHLRVLTWRTEAISLFVSYGDDYFDEKEKVLSTYEFATTEEVGFNSFDYKNYTYYIGKNGHEKYYSYEIFMIGFDDSNKYISYLYFYDSDLDMATTLGGSKERQIRELCDLIDESFIWLDFQ